MTVDEFIKFYNDRWAVKAPQAFADDCRSFLRDYAGEALMRASKRLVIEWTKDRRPTVADIADLCRQENPKRYERATGEINRKQQFDWVNQRIPELLADWKRRNLDLARTATANGWGGDLKQDLLKAAHLYAQYEWLIDNGHMSGQLPEFDPKDAKRAVYWHAKPSRDFKNSDSASAA